MKNLHMGKFRIFCVAALLISCITFCVLCAVSCGNENDLNKNPGKIGKFLVGKFKNLLTVSSEPKIKYFYTFFDTVCSVSSYADESDEQFDFVCSEIELILDDWHKMLDIYHEYDGINNLCTVNKRAGSWVCVDKKLVDFLKFAKDGYEISGGEMNVMMGSVLKLWHDCWVVGLGAESAETSILSKNDIPTKTELEEAALHVSIDKLLIDEANCAVKIADEEASLDVGALGKGYAAERVADYLENTGISGYVLNFGGNVRLVGEKPDGNAWIVAVKNPSYEKNPDYVYVGNADFETSSTSMYAARLNLKDSSCVTSGNYERSFTINGKRYHHIIDKDTLVPANYFASVTVVARDSGYADMLSTALFCMSLDEGLELAASRNDFEALWITLDGRQFQTVGFENLKRNRHKISKNF